MAQPRAGQWGSGMCDCLSDVSSCLITCFVPCMTYGQNVERFGRGPLLGGNDCLTHTIVFVVAEAAVGLGCGLIALQRQMVREKYGIPGDAVSDVCAGLCCPCCALAQMNREIHAREALVNTVPNAQPYQQPIPQPVVYAQQPAPVYQQPAPVYQAPTQPTPQ